jgi:hypothetical protein
MIKKKGKTQGELLDKKRYVNQKVFSMLRAVSFFKALKHKIQYKKPRKKKPILTRKQAVRFWPQTQGKAQTGYCCLAS